MAEKQKITFLQGVQANVLASGINTSGKPFYATDTNSMFIGTGSDKVLVGRTGVGLLTARPAAGVSGRTFYATDTFLTYVDNGSSWVVSNTAAPGVDTQVLFNDGGITAGHTGLKYVKATSALTIAGSLGINGAPAGTYGPFMANMGSGLNLLFGDVGGRVTLSAINDNNSANVLMGFRSTNFLFDIGKAYFSLGAEFNATTFASSAGGGAVIGSQDSSIGFGHQIYMSAAGGVTSIATWDGVSGRSIIHMNPFGGGISVNDFIRMPNTASPPAAVAGNGHIFIDSLNKLYYRDVSGTDNDLTSGGTNWAVPGALGSTTPNSVAATTVTTSGMIKSTQVAVANISAFRAESVFPRYTWYKTDGGGDAKAWDIHAATANTLSYQIVNDVDDAGVNYLTVTRSGMTLDTFRVHTPNFVTTGLQTRMNSSLVEATALVGTSFFDSPMVVGVSGGAHIGFTRINGAAGPVGGDYITFYTHRQSVSHALCGTADENGTWYLGRGALSLGSLPGSTGTPASLVLLGRHDTPTVPSLWFDTGTNGQGCAIENSGGNLDFYNGGNTAWNKMMSVRATGDVWFNQQITVATPSTGSYEVARFWSGAAGTPYITIGQDSVYSSGKAGFIGFNGASGYLYMGMYSVGNALQVDTGLNVTLPTGRLESGNTKYSRELTVFRQDDTIPTTQVTRGELAGIRYVGSSDTAMWIQFELEAAVDPAKDIIIRIFAAMTNAETSKNVKLDLAGRVLAGGEDPALATEFTATDTLAVVGTANTFATVLTNIKIPAAEHAGDGNLVSLKLSRDTSVASNHTGGLDIFSMKVYQT